MVKQRFQWPQAAATRLLELYKSGASIDLMASTISDESGFTITRKSIINKLERLGYTHFTNRTLKSETVITGRKPPMRIVPDKVPGKLSLDEVQEINGCRWPSGAKGNFTFCGNKYDPESPFPYCHEHLRRSVRTAA
jgi:hypothetical protein